MAERGGFISAAERVALDRFPDIDDVTIRCFDLSPRDLELIHRRRTDAGRLAGGLQIGALRWLGFVPPDLESAPPSVVDYVCSQLSLVSTESVDLGGYGEREQTKTDHVQAVEAHLAFRRPGQGDLKALGDWLVGRALEHDRPIVLFRMACEHLHANQIVRPGVTVIERAVLAARQRAIDETYFRIADQLDHQRRQRLADLLVVDDGLGMTPWAWLRRQAPTSTPAAIKEQIAKIELLRAVGADQLDLTPLNPNRVRHLASVGRRMTPQALDRLAVQRRYQILAATVVEELTDRVDEVLDLFDIALANLERAARRDDDETKASSATAATDAARAFAQVAGVVWTPQSPMRT